MVDDSFLKLNMCGLDEETISLLEKKGIRTLGDLVFSPKDGTTSDMVNKVSDVYQNPLFFKERGYSDNIYSEVALLCNTSEKRLLGSTEEDKEGVNRKIRSILEKDGLTYDYEYTISTIEIDTLLLRYKYFYSVEELSSFYNISRTATLGRLRLALRKLKDMLLYDKGSNMITHVPLSIRTKGLLLRNGIFTIKDLYGISKKDIMGMKYMGDKTYAKICYMLDNHRSVKGE